MQGKNILGFPRIYHGMPGYKPKYWKYLGDVGRSKYGKTEGLADKKSQMHVNRLLICMFIQSHPSPDQRGPVLSTSLLTLFWVRVLHSMCTCVTEVWLLQDQSWGVLVRCVSVHIRVRGGLCQQLEGSWGLGGIQVPATGETRTQGLAVGQTESVSPAAGGLCLVHTHRYHLTREPPSCSASEGSRMRLFLLLAFAQVLYVSVWVDLWDQLCIYTYTTYPCVSLFPTGNTFPDTLLVGSRGMQRQQACLCWALGDSMICFLLTVHTDDSFWIFPS